MIYTRHFYRIDEVCAALEYEIHRKRIQECLFWTLELIESEEFENIKTTLFKAWFHNIGLANIEIVYDILTIDKSTDIYKIVNNLINSKNDITLSIMFLHGLAFDTYKNNNVGFKLPDDLIQNDEKLDTFIRASCLGKYLDSLSLSFIISNEDFNTYSKKIIRHKFTNDIIYSIIDKLIEYNSIYAKVSIVGLVCFNQKYYESKNISKPIHEDYLNDIKKWDMLLGKRKRRIFQIPKECLYGRTYRGTLTYQQTNIDELYDTQKLIEGQVIFEEFINLYDTFENFKGHDKDYESFMDWYFPDDIPDEWSLEDQKKSHGNGVNQSNDKPLLRRYFNRWIDMKDTCKFWDKELLINNCIDKIKISSYNIENELLDLYKKKNIVPDSSWNFNNMRKILYSLE
jgi:hypothetical protein